MTDDERRQAERRRPTVILNCADAMKFIADHKYTGCFIAHAAEGVVKRIEIPNPAGWAVKPS